MTRPAGPPIRLHLALALLSVAVIAYQLVLMQILSITQWHHFAYMVISIALLGFGAAGTVLALAREWLLERTEQLLPPLIFASAAAMAMVVELAQDQFGGFDSYLLFVDPGQALRLLLVNLLFAAPFFLAALVIGLVFVRHVAGIGTLYFANLIGSGAGGAVAVLLLGQLVPSRLPALVALIALAAGLLTIRRLGWLTAWAAALVAVVVVALALSRPVPLRLSEYKDLQRALSLPEARLLAEAPSPYGLVQVVGSPALRQAPGVSLAYSGAVPVRPAVFSNGNGIGAIPQWPPAGNAVVEDFTTGALPYAVADPRSVLVLGAGTGTEIAKALRHEAGRVVAVEPHGALIEMLQRDFSPSAGALLGHPAVTLSVQEPRTWLATTAGRYDLIVLPTIGAFGGSAGLFALQEQHLLTREAIAQMLGRLSPDGLLCVTAWLDYPPRRPLRLAATLAEALAMEGFSEPLAHLAAVRGWGTLTFCVSRSPLTPEQIAGVNHFCERLRFDPALLPNLDPQARERYNVFEGRGFFEALERIFSPARQQLYAEYPFRLRPATDDRPFFSQFLRWEHLPELLRQFGERTFPFIEMGYLIVGLAFLLMLSASLVLIILPLFRLGWRRGGRWRTLFYFGGLGVGYMLVEIIMIHRFVLYLGHPIYAAAVVIGALLTFSGAGSFASTCRSFARLPPFMWAGLVALLVLGYGLLLPQVLESTMALSLGLKVLLVLLLLSVPGFVMGLPFPLGLRALAVSREADIPWAWGINGCFSVLSTALATIAAVELGFSAVLLFAAAAYAVAGLSRLAG